MNPKQFADALHNLTAMFDTNRQKFAAFLIETGTHTKGSNADDLLEIIAEFYQVELPE